MKFNKDEILFANDAAFDQGYNLGEYTKSDKNKEDLDDCIGLLVKNSKNKPYVEGFVYSLLSLVELQP